MWMLSRATVTRVAGLATQITLAWLLEPEHFGIIGLAYSIQGFAKIVQTTGLNIFLVTRQDEYNRYANAGFWYSVFTGLAASGIMLLCAPLATRLWNSPELVGMLIVMAMATPFQAMGTVSRARLSIDLKFRTLALFNVSFLVGRMALSVLFAWAGFGAYSFVLPLLIISPLRALTLYLLVRPPIHWRFEFSHWRSIFRLSVLILITAIFGKIVNRGDYLILGAFFENKTVGLYFFAYSLSVQSIMLISKNLTGILFPILSKIQFDPARQRNAFLRASRVLALLAIPVSMLISALADPLVRLIYADKWLSAIPLLQILAVSMAFRASGSIAGSYLNSQKKFRRLLLASIIQCILFFLLTLPAVQIGLREFVIAISLVYIICPIINLLLALGFSKGSLLSLARIFCLPLIASAVAALLYQPVKWAIPPGSPGWIAEIVIGIGLFASVTLALIWKFDRPMWAELIFLKEKLLTREMFSDNSEMESNGIRLKEKDHPDLQNHAAETHIRLIG